MMTNRTDVFQILEIEPTEDKRAIRKAYARLVKQYHPEEQPEKWKEIHDAYEAAIHMAERGGASHDSVRPQAPDSNSAGDDAAEVVPERPEDNPTDIPPEQMRDKPADAPQDRIPYDRQEQEEINALFEQVREIASDQMEQRQRQKKEVQDERIRQLIKIITDLLEKEMFSQKTWSMLLEQESVFPLLCSSEFLYAFGDCFQGKRISAELYRYLRTQITRIQNYDESKGLEASASLWGEWNSIEEAIGYAAGKIDAAHYANIGRQVKEQARRKRREKLWILPKAFLLFLGMMMIAFGIVFLFFIK